MGADCDGTDPEFITGGNGGITLIIGEKINGSISSVARAITECDADII